MKRLSLYPDINMSDSKLQKVIFTDLDGTLLDASTYSYAPAVPALELLRQQKIPVVFCSAKTKAEQEVYRSEMGISDPFIVESGGAIFIPQYYFSLDTEHYKVINGYSVIELSVPYQQIRATLQRIKASLKVDFKSFGDMSVEEVAADTGLDLEAAYHAKQRYYDETIKLEDTPENIKKIIFAIEETGLKCVQGGNYYRVGSSDKGKAIALLIKGFKRKLGRILTIGLGDSLNDLPLFKIVDIPMLVEKPGPCWEEMKIPRLRRIEGVGPVGWNRAIHQLVA